MKTLEEIINTAVENRVSDIHIACNVPVKYRIDGQLQSLDDYVLTWDDCENLGKEVAKEKFEEIKSKGELDLALSIGGARTRLSVFRSKGAISLSIRILADKIPELEKLGLPPVVGEFASYKKGIVLVTGETGSGKSTTLAAILNNINHTRKCHIITLEDPIEYIYNADQSLINQREVGTDTANYANGLRAILREDPNVILIGEMRDSETIETALTAAETGHLVFATLHTNSAVDSVDRIVGTFSADKQPQIRQQLASTLKAVLAQQLVVKKGGVGRVAVCEVMIVNDAIRNQIREGNTAQMQSSLLSSANIGAITMDNNLINMVKNNIIDKETAIDAAINADYVKQSIGFSRGPKGFDTRSRV